MRLTTKYINTLREKSFMNISKELEKKLLVTFADDIHSEPDLHEQIRKLVQR